MYLVSLGTLPPKQNTSCGILIYFLAFLPSFLPSSRTREEYVYDIAVSKSTPLAVTGLGSWRVFAFPQTYKPYKKKRK